MIYEVIVSTLNADGSPNWAPMGLKESEGRYFLYPYKSSHTYRNLLRFGYFVANMTDDILSFCLTALDDPNLQCREAQKIAGFVYVDVCSWIEFEASEVSEEADRGSFLCSLLYYGIGRPFKGYNRAKCSIMELLIAATRYQFYKKSFFDRCISEAKIIVEKTGGEREMEALAVIDNYLKGVFS